MLDYEILRHLCGTHEIAVANWHLPMNDNNNKNKFFLH